MPKKQHNLKKPTDQNRLIDLLERIGVLGLYLSTDLGQNDIAGKLSMDTHRVNAILKGLKKPPKK